MIAVTRKFFVLFSERLCVMLQVPGGRQVGGGGWREQSLLCPAHPGQDSKSWTKTVGFLFVLRNPGQPGIILGSSSK